MNERDVTSSAAKAIAENGTKHSPASHEPNSIGIEVEPFRSLLFFEGKD